MFAELLSEWENFDHWKLFNYEKWITFNLNENGDRDKRERINCFFGHKFTIGMSESLNRKYKLI